MPFFNSNGRAINSISEGKTSQNMLDDKALTLETSFVSIYSQIMASTDINGIDARIAPVKELRLAISEIRTINIVVTAIFVM
jgi:hypothetical protein